MQHAPKSRGAISKPAHWPQGLSTTCLRHCSDRRGEDRGTSRMQLRKAHWPQGPRALEILWAYWKSNAIRATLNQKQSQWIAIHCCASPTGLNLMIHCSTCMWREAAFYVIELHRLGWQIVKGTLVPCLIPPRPIGCRMLGCNSPYLRAVLGPQVRRRRQPQPLRPLVCQQCPPSSGHFDPSISGAVSLHQAAHAKAALMIAKRLECAP